MLVAEAAIPERSGGTTVRGTDVTGTNSMPMPMPANGRTHPSVPKSTVGDSTALATRMPPPARRHPIVMGQRGPIRATSGPVNADAMISPAAIGRKSTAVWYADALATTWRYNAVKKKMEKVPKYATKATKLEPANGGLGTSRGRASGS